jgi:formylglycine-generating enzyme required for sulfatase activity
LSNADCSGAAPVCNTTTNACQARPSCVGLAKTCGPSGNADCCASTVVTGDTSNAFKRDNDPGLPAKVSTFRLDAYEITVGRFRKFVAAYTQSMTKDGTGANPHNSSDPGWDASWNTELPASATAMKPLLKCASDLATWTDTAGANESLPINCASWLELEAFCIWDGGRLPTDAEWNYAAAGGLKQRTYPWGSTAPDCSHATYTGAANGEQCQPMPIRVGSLSTIGDGFYGQADLAGNVMEFVQDISTFPKAATCDNCAALSNDPFAPRVVRGGGFSSYTDNLTNSSHEIEQGTVRLTYAGARCARVP